MWQGTNLNKRGITLDLTSDEGRELVRRLVRDADVVVENFSPRVIEQFGLDYESLVELKPDVILVRMPGFGLQGPWRDYVGWALNFEQTSGMAGATGYADGPPCNLQGPADPIVGVHAGVALLAALEHRCRTGEGQLIEVAQIEVAACVAAEPVIEYSMNAVVRPREGNRCRGVVQGVYPTAEDDTWVALCVRDDADWATSMSLAHGTFRQNRCGNPTGCTIYRNSMRAVTTRRSSTRSQGRTAIRAGRSGSPPGRATTTGSRRRCLGSTTRRSCAAWASAMTSSTNCVHAV
jgi:crotonobetainyl-CoA:carnitine CoA-transferase CaiB-like acyl-CoA transferase